MSKLIFDFCTTFDIQDISDGTRHWMFVRYLCLLLLLLSLISDDSDDDCINGLYFVCFPLLLCLFDRDLSFEQLSQHEFWSTWCDFLHLETDFVRRKRYVHPFILSIFSG